MGRNTNCPSYTCESGEARQRLLFLHRPWGPLHWQATCSLGDGAIIRLFVPRPFPALPAFALHGRGRHFSAPQLPNRFLTDPDKGRRWQGIRGSERQGEARDAHPFRCHLTLWVWSPRYGLPSVVLLLSPHGSCLWVLVPEQHTSYVLVAFCPG